MTASGRGPKRNREYMKPVWPLESTLYWSTFIHYAVASQLNESSSFSSSSRGISFEIPLDVDLPFKAPSPSGMTRSASSDGLGFKVHYASRGGMKRQQSLPPVDINGQSRQILEEEDFTSHKPVGRNHTFSVKNQSRYRWGRWITFHKKLQFKKSPCSRYFVCYLLSFVVQDELMLNKCNFMAQY